jgi:uncharacterized protein (UPF0335 family)
MAKAQRKADNDIDNDPMFDTSKAAKQKALDRRLIQLLERAERLEGEKKGLADDLKDVFSEGKAVGYDAKMMKAMIKLRKMNPDDRAELDALMETYRAAIGLD